MSEKNNINEFDLMMKSILEEGQEEVPARIWDGVSDGLDRAARRKTVVLWFRRAAAGVVAAAAVVAGVFFNSGNDEILVPEAVNSDMIAVVEQVAIPEETETVSDHVYVAMARQERRENIAEDKSLSEVPITSYDAVKEEESHVTEVPEADYQWHASCISCGNEAYTVHSAPPEECFFERYGRDKSHYPWSS